MELYSIYTCILTLRTGFLLTEKVGSWYCFSRCQWYIFNLSRYTVQLHIEGYNKILPSMTNKTVFNLFTTSPALMCSFTVQYISNLTGLSLGEDELVGKVSDFRPIKVIQIAWCTLSCLRFFWVDICHTITVEHACYNVQPFPFDISFSAIIKAVQFITPFWWCLL